MESPKSVSRQISGESAVPAISQNFFVGRETTTAFSGNKAGEKE
jgi:hypothetical protein